MSTRTILALLVPLVTVVGVAVFVVGELGPSARGGETPPPSNVALATPTPSPSPVAPPSRTPDVTPTATPAAFVLGESGDWVLVGSEDGAVRVTVVGASGERQLYDSGGPLFYPPVPGGHVAASVSGSVAILVTDEAAGTESTWVFDAGDPRAPGRLLAGHPPAFGPDGDLVTLHEDGSIRHHLLGEGGAYAGEERLTPPDGVAIERPVLVTNGSGLIGRAGDDVVDWVVLGWDGSTKPYDPVVAPWLATGIERVASAAGDRITDRFEWVSADGDRRPIELPAGVARQAVWDRTGRTAVIVADAGDGVRLYTIDASNPSAVRPLATLPGVDTRIAGSTDDAVIVTLASGESIAVGLDGSGTLGERHKGTLALIVP